MYLIVGLGNPEPEYSFTRHNLGFDVLNKIAEEYDIKISKSGFKSIYGTGIIEKEKVILCKPQTYMNLSGDAIIEIAKFYKIQTSNIIIIYDDIDLETGIIKIRKKGGPGGHNGMKSVVERLQTEEFPRIRIGTGFCESKDNLIEYVLAKLSNEEYVSFLNSIDTAKNALISILQDGMDEAMNKYN